MSFNLVSGRSEAELTINNELLPRKGCSFKQWDERVGQRSCWGSSYHSPLFFFFFPLFASTLTFVTKRTNLTPLSPNLVLLYLCLVCWFSNGFPSQLEKYSNFLLELTGSDMSCSLIVPLLISYFFPHWVLAKNLTYQKIMLWGHGLTYIHPLLASSMTDSSFINMSVQICYHEKGLFWGSN